MHSDLAKVRLWTERDGRPRLQGIRCDDCGITTFPATNGCIVCGSLAQTVIDLAPRGLIESCTRIGERTVCEIRLHAGPVLMGWVDDVTPVHAGSVVRFEPCDHELRFVPDG